jgi:hypothetical protein
MSKQRGIPAVAWFYSQSFNGGTREQVPAPAQITPGAEPETEAEEVSEEPEWGDSDIAREMYASIGFRG